MSFERPKPESYVIKPAIPEIAKAIIAERALFILKPFTNIKETNPRIAPAIRTGNIRASSKK